MGHPEALQQLSEMCTCKVGGYGILNKSFLIMGLFIGSFAVKGAFDPSEIVTHNYTGIIYELTIALIQKKYMA